MGATARIATYGTACLLVLSALVVGQPIRLTEIGICHDQSACASRDDYKAERAEMIREQVARFRCTPARRGQIPSSALVRDTHRVPRVGIVVDGTVRRESFDAAFAHAGQGRVLIIRWCER